MFVVRSEEKLVLEKEDELGDVVPNLQFASPLCFYCTPSIPPSGVLVL
jgi:hypothetical protein